MVKLLNSWIVVSNDDPSYFSLHSNLVITEKSKKLRSKRNREIIIPEKRIPLYSEVDSNMFIPIGLYSLISQYFSSSTVHDLRKKTSLSDTDDIISKIDSYNDILDGITLRKDQLIACRKMLYFKRCIIQMSTGSGKSEIMCAFMKLLSVINGYQYPTTLIIEPTKRLQYDIASRFEKYEIPTTNYSNNRMVIPNCINICHPASLGNDIDKNPNLLSEVQVLLGDETHHMKSESWRKPTYSTTNLEYSIGLSASAISQDHINGKSISDFHLGELLTIGATGPLVMNVNSSVLISGDKLAKPVLLMLHNPADEKLDTGNPANWADVSKNVLESDHRAELICESAKFFDSVDRKVLILVRTVGMARKILSKLYSYGIGDRVRGSYGSGRFEYYNGAEYEADDSDVFKRYSSGEFNILIGTPHIYEGVDVPNLDVVILGYAGKSDRMHIQGIGRALRKTKSGKYAYIVDFYDAGNPVLFKHSRIRIDRYSKVIGVADEHMFIDLDIDDISDIFKSLES